MAGDKIACPTVNMDVMLVRMRPRPPLDQFVECLWRMDAGPSPHARERALPTGTVELVFDLRAGEPVICGPHSSYFELDTSVAISVIGVHFKPGGAAAFLGTPAGEFADRLVSLADVWGSRANGLRDRLVDAIHRSLELPAREMIDFLHRDLMEWTDGRNAPDDVTFFIVKAL